MDNEMIWALAGITAILWAALTLIALIRHRRTHNSIESCIGLAHRVLETLCDEIFTQSRALKRIDSDVDGLSRLLPSAYKCSMCNKTDFADNMVKLSGAKLNRLGVVPLKGDLKYLPGELVILHADCAGIRKCDSDIGWEKISPVKKTEGR